MHLTFSDVNGTQHFPVHAQEQQQKPKSSLQLQWLCHTRILQGFTLLHHHKAVFQARREFSLLVGEIRCGQAWWRALSKLYRTSMKSYWLGCWLKCTALEVRLNASNSKNSVYQPQLLMHSWIPIKNQDIVLNPRSPTTSTPLKSLHPCQDTHPSALIQPSMQAHLFISYAP